MDPLHLYGANNVLLNKITAYFPKLRIVARGHEIICIGDEVEIKKFEEKIELLIEFYHKYNKITLTNIEDLFSGIESPWLPESDNKDILVYGNHGKLIKAKSINQKVLVDEYDKNDLLF
ncbi:MAG: phosphate starvation-inducible protein PhoH, partial [Bacteroidales bacterium]|nr:phosphate starvation-inducible protein PhoH [Bacteroidales bacterium]